MWGVKMGVWMLGTGEELMMVETLFDGLKAHLVVHAGWDRSESLG